MVKNTIENFYRVNKETSNEVLHPSLLASRFFPARREGRENPSPSGGEGKSREGKTPSGLVCFKQSEVTKFDTLNLNKRRNNAN
jgi:hypothetical protein